MFNKMFKFLVKIKLCVKSIAVFKTIYHSQTQMAFVYGFPRPRSIH